MRYEVLGEIRPERDVLRCLPDSDADKQSILEYQSCFGIAAYDSDTFVGSLWFYRIVNKELACPPAPPWSGWSKESDLYPQISEAVASDLYPILGLSCFHVGRTKALQAKDRNDESYYGVGIGTGLLEAAAEWASARDYGSMVGCAGMGGSHDFNNWAGWLPMKVYSKHDFVTLFPLDCSAMVPGHLKDKFDRERPTDTEMGVMIRSLVG
jgi:hypothetical protein